MSDTLQAEYQRRYREANRQKRRDQARRYYLENKERIKEYQRAYREENLEKVRAREKARYRVDARNRAEEGRRNRATPAGRAAHLLHNARKRGECTISREWLVQKLEAGVCEITGIPFEYPPSGTGPRAPSLDQLVPGAGYTPENTRVVIWMYNAAKNIFTDADVLAMARALTLRGGPGII